MKCGLCGADMPPSNILAVCPDCMANKPTFLGVPIQWVGSLEVHGKRRTGIVYSTKPTETDRLMAEAVADVKKNWERVLDRQRCIIELEGK